MRFFTHGAQQKKREGGSPAFGGAKGDRGFTLIEVMVSMSIFMILVTMGMQAVYAAITEHRQTQAIRTVMDSLNFVMEDMARNIRLGANLHCLSAGELLTSAAWDPTTMSVVPQSCTASGSNSIFFNGVNHTTTNGDFIDYVITSPYAATPNVVMKVTGDPTIAGSAKVVTPPEVKIDLTKSGFLVRGALVPPGDNSQPTVVIRLAGTITSGGVATPFSLQTAVTLRGIDPQ